MKKSVYRIKIVTFKNGVQKFLAYKKCGLVWMGVLFSGDTMFGYAQEYYTREQALEAIDKNHSGNRKIQSIHFEYITK